MNKQKFGPSLLKPDELSLYHLLEEAIYKGSNTCDISSVKKNIDVTKVLYLLLGDNPQIIHIDKSKVNISGNIFKKELHFMRSIDVRKQSHFEAQLQKSLEDAVWEIDKSSRNDREILVGISEYLQRNVKYDINELNNMVKRRSVDPLAHNAYGALVRGSAVCDGFSSAYSLIAQYFGLKTMAVKGKSTLEESSMVDHVWNIVEYQGAHFHVDATWDANSFALTNTYSYSYFGVDDTEISLNHDWNYEWTPICNSNELSYFSRNNIYANSESQIEEIIYKQLKNQEKVVRLKIAPGINLTDHFEKYLVGIIQTASARSRNVKPFRYQWERSMRCLTIIIK